MFFGRNDHAQEEIPGAAHRLSQRPDTRPSKGKGTMGFNSDQRNLLKSSLRRQLEQTLHDSPSLFHCTSCDGTLGQFAGIKAGVLTGPAS